MGFEPDVMSGDTSARVDTTVIMTGPDEGPGDPHPARSFPAEKGESRPTDNVEKGEAEDKFRSDGSSAPELSARQESERLTLGC